MTSRTMLLVAVFWVLAWCWIAAGCGVDPGIDVVPGAHYSGITLDAGPAVFLDDEDPSDDLDIPKMQGQLQATMEHFAEFCQDQDCAPVVGALSVIVLKRSCPIITPHGSEVWGYYNKVGAIPQLENPEIRLCTDRLFPDISPWANGTLVHELIHHLEQFAKAFGGQCLNAVCMADNDHNEDYWKDVGPLARQGDKAATE